MTFIALLRQAVITHRCIERGEVSAAQVARRARISIIDAQEWLRLFRCQPSGIVLDTVEAFHENQ